MRYITRSEELYHFAGASSHAIVTALSCRQRGQLRRFLFEFFLTPA